MKISSIPSIYRNLNRVTEIATVLSRYGLADWLSRFQLDFPKGFLKDRNGEVLARQSREVRLRLAISELGPTFIKLGQLLSTRPDVVGQAIAEELQKLRDAAPADPPELVRTIVERELARPLDEAFQEFDLVPLASASIGQVHRAILPNGAVVAVKVQHFGISDTIRKDLDVMAGLAQLAEMLPEMAPYRPVATLAEVQRILKRELDFTREQRHLSQFAARFRHVAGIRIPKPYEELCTPQVLTMEFLQGTRVAHLAADGHADLDLDAVARQGAEAYLQMIFRDGVYHADPHPGNLLILTGNVLGLLDFGMVGRVDDELREQIEDALLAIVQPDANRLAELLTRIGKPQATTDLTTFRSDVADFVSVYAHQPLDQLDLSRVLGEMTEIIYRYRITLPPQVSLLLKTLISLEGTARLLSPQFSLIEVIQPFQRRALLRRYSPARRMKKLRRALLEFEHLASEFPRRTLQLLEQAQVGEFNMRLEHRRLGPSVNRLVLGMLASALFLGSSLMLSQKVPPLLFREGGWMGIEGISVLGLAGCVVSILLSVRLLWAIGKSGHLDRRE